MNPLALAPTLTLKKYHYASLTDNIRHLEIPQTLVNTIFEQNNIIEILNQLLSHNEVEAAVELLAMGLPKREVIWWAFITIKDQCLTDNEIAIQKTTQLIQTWVHEPTEASRHQLKNLSDKLTLFSPMGWVAEAVFYSGGSIAPEGQEEILPDALSSHICAANAIKIFIEKNKLNDKKIHFLIRQGLHIAMGGNGNI